MAESKAPRVARRDYKGTLLAQVKLEGIQEAIADYIRQHIQKGDLLVDDQINKGRAIETDTHVTLHLGAPQRLEAIDKVIRRTEVFDVTIEGLDCFSNAPRKFTDDPDGKEHAWDVLFAKIADPLGRLVQLHRLFVQETKIEPDYPFHPHVTMAYLRHGCARKYIEAHDSGRATLGPWKATIHAVSYKPFQKRDPDGEAIVVPLQPAGGYESHA